MFHFILTTTDIDLDSIDFQPVYRYLKFSVGLMNKVCRDLLQIVSLLVRWHITVDSN